MADRDLFLSGEVAGLEDRLRDDAPRLAYAHQVRDLAPHHVRTPALQSANVDDHVDFGRALVDRVAGFERFGLHGVLAQRKPDGGSDADPGGGEQSRARFHFGRIDGHHRETVVDGLLAEPFDVRGTAKRLQKRMIDDPGQLVHSHDCLPCGVRHHTNTATEP